MRNQKCQIAKKSQAQLKEKNQNLPFNFKSANSSIFLVTFI